MLKRISHVLFSKSFIFGILVVFQLAILFVLIYNFAQLGIVAYVIVTIITILVFVAIFQRDTLNPAYKIMWIVIFTIMPVFGVVFYLLWGQRKVPGKRRKHLIKAEAESQRYMQQNLAVLESLKKADRSIYRSAKYLWLAGSAPVYPVDTVKYYPFGEDFFSDFIEDLKTAKKYIYMEYFIVEEGYMWDTTLAVLKEKIAQGVEVRILYDGFGSIATLPSNYPKRLNDMGIKCVVFSPIEFDFRISEYAMINHRDHRKMTIIDDKFAYSGGLNFADEYINKVQRFGIWKDTTFKATGASVYSFTLTFLHMWAAMSGEEACYELYSQPIISKSGLPDKEMMENGLIQPYYDSPLTSETVAKNAYLNIINTAQDYVYIVTPYLILDFEMISSLSLAANSGVDVRIITPGIPDKPTVFALTQSYYPTLLESGVRIFEYAPGFMHAKMYVSDDNIAVVGSANMDYRSLYLHFENCASFYGGEMPGWVKEDVLQTIAVSKEITLEDTRNVGFFKRIVQIFTRFFAPLM